jgi:purine-binding chemotaxis protein CheW
MAQRKFASFYIGDTLFSIDIILVREINRSIEITPVDLVVDSIRGLINLRGQLVTIFDLGIQLGMEKTVITESTRSVILKTNSEVANLFNNTELEDSTSDDVVGFLVDKIGDIITTDTGSIQSPPAHLTGIQRKFIKGVYKLESELLIILNCANLLTVA